MMSSLPDAPGCRLPFGLGFLAFVALLVLSLMVGFAALSLLLGGLAPVPNQQPGVNGPGGNQVRPVPPISQRYFDAGSSQAAVTGAMSYAGTLGIDTIRSYVDNEGLAWIGFGGIGGGPEVLVTFNEPEDAVTVANGVVHATAQDAQCAFNVTVTPTLVSGHISCPTVDAYDGDEKIGTTRIELDFSAGSPPGGGIETDPPEE